MKNTEQKMNYITPEIKVCETEQADVITGSLTLQVESLGDKLTWEDFEKL